MTRFDIAPWRRHRQAVDFTRANAVLPAARARLFAIPGVHAVGLGKKIVGGEFTDEPAIMVFVERKTPIADLDPAHVIPADIDGVSTDVYESAIPHVTMAPPAEPPHDLDKHRPLYGGLQIEPGGVTVRQGGIEYTGMGSSGTLGCFVRIDQPTTRIFGVTNFHVLGHHAFPQETNLTCQPDATDTTSATRAFSCSGATVTPGTQVVIETTVTYQTKPVVVTAFYIAGQSDTIAAVATQLADGLTGSGKRLPNSGLTGNATNGTLTVQVNGNPNPARLYGPFPPTAGDVHAKTTVGFVQVSNPTPPVPPMPTPPNPLTAMTTITLSGSIDKFGGAYVTVNAGLLETYGTFVPSSNQLATDIASAIQALAIPTIVAAKVDANTLVVYNAESVLIQFSSDTRVGQPTNALPTLSCSQCSNDRIGVVAFGDLRHDVGLIQLDAGIQYQPYVPSVGQITGPYNVTANDVGKTFWLRGKTSSTGNSGTLVAHSVDGKILWRGWAIDGGAQSWQQTLIRYYAGAFHVASSVAGSPFVRPGDSGSAILTAPNNGTTQVAGICFGETDKGATGLCTPIQPILDAITKWANNNTATVDTWDPANPTKTVPGTPGSTAHPALARVAHRDLTPAGTEAARLNQVQSEIGATPGGQRYGALIMRHLGEAQTLVNTNRKMATVWHRNGGPAITDGLLRMLEIPGQRIPSVINGTPLEDCLQQIASAFARYGSDALAADIKAYSSALIQLAHLTYPELLQTLELGR